GLHLPEEVGGSGYGLDELVVVVEETGRALLPGPFVPTVIASATVDATGSSEQRARLLPGLADGSLTAAIAFDGDLTVSGDAASGSVRTALCGGVADLLLVPIGDDVAVITLREDAETATGVSVEVPINLDPTRRSARLTLDGAAADLLVGARQALLDHIRLLFAAEAVGIARECTEQAAAYAKERQQFGRPIAMFQAVKHHCANMLVATELATGAVWDAARTEAGTDELSAAAAAAATLAIPAADLCAQLNIQVHGGIGFTWEHDAHMFLRRATAVERIVSAEQAAAQLTDLHRAGVRRSVTIELPPEAEAFRDEVRGLAERIKELPANEQRAELIDSGYAMAHWPKPWGRDAGAVEQIVIQQELDAAGVKKPAYGITGWVILTLIQYATADQIARWVRPALDQEVIWCQLFSEPDAGSDAAGITTKATRVDGGWLINGQKVWTSGAHVAGFGFATVRTNPDVPKHEGITVVVIDMHADGVEVRPLKMPMGVSEFNEVFFTDVFVPDDDVVGPVDGGWTVARATLGNESVSIGGGEGGMAVPAEVLVEALDANPDHLAGGTERVGRYAASTRACDILNLRSAHRAVAGAAPGPEGAITKLVLSENLAEAAAVLNALNPDAAYLEGAGMFSGSLVLWHRGMSIAGGTSEIKRNQIGERILGLPRDPLIK
ncbi:MAG: acyl-CoA dehydrogenase, partial [Actinobacteria bacterium]|nr:acyl-CoA dehydrogenase [Actinomycetota bacterium]